MNEFIEKLIGRLEEKENEAVLKAPNTNDISNIEYQKWMMKSYGFKESIEIVNQLAEEYNNKSVKGDLISRSAVIRELNGIYLDNPYDDKEDILEKAIGIVDYFSAPYQPKGE